MTVAPSLKGELLRTSSPGRVIAGSGCWVSGFWVPVPVRVLVMDGDS